MPTLRERTSTSSGAIVGTSSSRTAALRGSSNTSAFMQVASSLFDQDLDLVRGTRREPRERVRRAVQRVAARDDPFDGQVARRDLRGDPAEVVDPVTPGADDRHVVERPE